MTIIILKRIFFVFLAIVPLGLVIGFSNSWTNFPSISIGGSSAVEPLSSALGNSYNDADVSVVAGGSSAGIKYAVLSEKDIGNASTNPYTKVVDATIVNEGWDRSTWQVKDMKTVTIAWDAIAIVYKPPSNINYDLVISNENINKLYEIFAGYSAFPFSAMDTNFPSNISFSPYARTGGSSASGTATSFLTESSFSNVSKLDKLIIDSLKKGDYGRYTTPTNESNIESWTRLKSDGKEGSIIYLSLGFVKKNILEINKAGFKVAKYKNEISGIISDPTGITEDDKLSKIGYGWFSPLNSIFSLKLSTDAVKDFMWWVFTDELANSIISNHGFIPLTFDYKRTMLWDKNIVDIKLPESKKIFFESSDYRLENDRIGDDKLWYGAPK